MQTLHRTSRGTKMEDRLNLQSKFCPKDSDLVTAQLKPVHRGRGLCYMLIVLQVTYRRHLSPIRT